MKKQLTRLLLIAAAVSFASCSQITGYKMDSEEGVQAVLDALKKNINPDEWKIIEINWDEEEELENKIFTTRATLVNAKGDIYSQSYFLSGSMKGEVTDLSLSKWYDNYVVEYDNVKGIDPARLSAKEIVRQMNEAKAQLPEEYEFKSVGEYKIKEALPNKSDFFNRDKEFGAHEASFMLRVTEKGNEKVSNAGKTTIIYYEVPFVVMPDGSVEVDE